LYNNWPGNRLGLFLLPQNDMGHCQPRVGCISKKQELIMRSDSERKHFYDDIAHVLQNIKKRNPLRLTN